jgi:biopolymer transport protein ExbD
MSFGRASLGSGASGSRATGGGGQRPMSDINVTPLVDVMLVLLVIFIITAPLFQQAVPIDLPRVASTPLEDNPRVLRLALDGEGQLFLDGAAVPSDALAERLAAFAAAPGPAPELHLHADRGARYERVTDMMAAAQRVGITRIAFVTDAAAREAR